MIVKKVVKQYKFTMRTDILGNNLIPISVMGIHPVLGHYSISEGIGNFSCFTTSLAIFLCFNVLIFSPTLICPFTINEGYSPFLDG